MNRAHTLSRVTQRLLNNPLALHPSYGAMVVAAVHSRLGIDTLNLSGGEFRYPGVQPRGEGLKLDREMLELMAEDGKESARVQTESRDRKQKLFALEGNVAYIPIEGTLCKNWGLEPESGCTGYDGIETKLVAAASDDDVAGIFMHYDSGGGEVAGLFPLVDMISAFSQRNGGPKPIYAYLGDYAYSAAYALASAADRIYMPETGGAGSVGVITMHANYRGAYEERGIDVTIIRSGERKAKPHPLEPIEKEDLERIQGQIDRIRDMFVGRVAKNRGLDTERVSKTEAVDYMGEDAVAIGFVDKIATEHQAWDDLLRAIA